MHVYEFDAFGYSGEVGDTNSSSVVSFKGRIGLYPSHFYESVAQGDHFLGGNIESDQFGLGGR